MHGATMRFMVKLSFPTPRRHKGGAEVRLHSFLTPALSGGEWLTSYPGRCTPRKKKPPVQSVSASLWEDNDVLSIPRLESRNASSNYGLDWTQWRDLFWAFAHRLLINEASRLCLHWAMFKQWEQLHVRYLPYQVHSWRGKGSFLYAVLH